MSDIILSLKSNELKDDKKLVDELDIEIKEKETVIFQSKNNSGSLILDSIYLKNKLDNIDIHYFNDSLSNYDQSDIDDYRSKDVSMVDDYESFFDEFNILDNIYLTANLNRIDVDKKIAQELINIFKINDILNEHYSNITYYEFIKAKTVRSLISKPFILLVYDVFKNMSDFERIEYMMMLNRINSLYNTTIIIETTDSSLFRLSTKKYIIDEGMILTVND